MNNIVLTRLEAVRSSPHVKKCLPPDIVTSTDLPAADTAGFILAHVSSGGRILEIGCGDGEVAAHLAAAGYRVVALDADRRSAARARRRGIDARWAVWPAFRDPGTFDAVVFTRSLHHVDPIDAAVTHAAQVLVPGGRVVVEDFAFSDLRQHTIDWLVGILEVLDASGALRRPDKGFGWQILATRGTGLSWVASHEGHSVTEMRQALAARFTLFADDAAPYLYRYLCPMLRRHRRRDAILARVRDLEMRAVATGVISPLGRRLVGIKAD